MTTPPLKGFSLFQSGDVRLIKLEVHSDPEVIRISSMKVSLYTITYSGMYYVGPHVPLRELIPKIKKLGYEGIEIEGKRPFGFPPDLDAKDRDEIKELAEAEGIEISAIASYSNFGSPIMEENENELLMVREQIRLASDLGAPLVRVFTAWKGVVRVGAAVSPPGSWVTYDYSRHHWKYPTTEIDTWRRVRNSLKECAGWAEEFGVYLALQNHTPVVRPGYEDTLQMVREVGSDYLKICLDYGGWDKEYTHEAVQECGDLIIHSHFGGNYIENSDGKVVPYPWGRGVYSKRQLEDLSRRYAGFSYYISELKKIGYNGHFGYEACSPIVIDHEPAGIEEVDRRARLAARYMKNTIAEA